MKLKAEAAILLVTILWGLSFPFIRIVLQEIHPINLIFIRSCIAASALIPFVLIIKKNRENLIKLLPIGFILGFLYFAAFTTQSIGLKTINSGRSAFITNLSVILVPLLSPLFNRGFPSRSSVISAFIAIIGMFFLTDPFNEAGISSGDLWTILCALCFSLQIHVLHLAMESKPYDMVYAFLQIAFIVMFSSLCLPFSHTPLASFHGSTKNFLLLIYLGLIAMVLTTWIQARYQRYTSPERVAIIYILEPVFASIFGFFILNETMAINHLVGGSLIILAVTWNFIFNLFKDKKM